MQADDSDRSIAKKVAADRPADVHDRCEYAPGVSNDTLDGTCLPPTAQTRYGTPRSVAGESELNDVNACTLKPLNRADYPAGTFTDAQWQTMKTLFPSGVCNWSAPGTGQQKSIAWQTYQDADGNVIYGGRALPAAPTSTPFKAKSRPRPRR